MQNRRDFIQKSVFSVGSLAFSEKIFAQSSKQYSLLNRKIEEAIYAFVVADAMGGSVENYLPEQTKKQFSDWDFTRFLPPTAKKDIESKLGKGDGRTTDDTLNLEALIGCYLRNKNHLDANSYAENWIKEITENKVWIAEKGAEMYPNDRPLWWPERYVYQRLAINNVEPRYAGMGNWINEGFQGIVLPVGAVNVGDPLRAYQEVTAFGMAHTESFGVEGAGVNAAAYAVAFQENTSIDEVLKAVLSVAKDGTKSALEDVLAATNLSDDLDNFIAKTRKAVLHYLQLSPKVLNKSENPETDKKLRENTNIARPSRIACIENVPIALAALKYGNGDYQKTLKASIFYGRDAESIAAVSTSLLAAISDKKIVPENLKKQVDEVNKRNYKELSNRFFETVKNIHQQDLAILEKRKTVF